MNKKINRVKIPIELEPGHAAIIIHTQENFDLICQAVIDAESYANEPRFSKAWNESTIIKN